MKNIHELLTAIGIDLPEDKKADFDKEFTANYKTVAGVSKITTARDNYKSQLETAQDALKEFEGVDVKELNGRITQLTNDLAAKESDYQAKIADMEFSTVLDNAISASGARDAVSVKAHLDLNTLKDSKNQAEGNVECWYCDGCGKYYNDAAATGEIAGADIVTKKLPNDLPAPKTGDSSNLLLWVALLFISGGVLTGATVLGKKKRFLTK